MHMDKHFRHIVDSIYRNQFDLKVPQNVETKGVRRTLKSNETT